MPPTLHREAASTTFLKIVIVITSQFTNNRFTETGCRPYLGPGMSTDFVGFGLGKFMIAYWASCCLSMGICVEN